jgi:hypothetical protein
VETWNDEKSCCLRYTSYPLFYHRLSFL